jgi:phosphodiesterase/alkaline phosphatase D-like protein
VLNPFRFTVAGVAATAVLAVAAAPAGAAATCVAGQAPAPAVLTKAAANVADTTATLQGSVNPNGCPTMYHFEYGLTAAYGAVTTDTAGGSGTSFVAATGPITGLKPNTTYHFRIVATSVGGTVGGSDATFTTKPACVAGVSPTVLTRAATAIASGSATLHATVNPLGCPTTYEFQYGTTIAYGKATSIRSAGSGTTPMSVSAPVSGLSPGTVYHFRIVAKSAGGTAVGADAFFQTAAGCVHNVTAPLVVTLPPAAVAQTSAVLRATVNPDNCATTYWFQYGLTTRYGKATTRQLAGSGALAVPASISIGGLTPGTVYHFRILAKSSGGIRHGADQVFRTASPPAARIRIDGRRPAVRRGFFVAVHLHCSLGTSGCAGAVRLFRNGRPLGRQGYATIAPGNSEVVLMHLNLRGRRLVRHHRQLRHVEIIARSTHNTAIRFVTLVRTFRP